MAAKKENRCWPGYEPVPGKPEHSEGSCRPKAESKLTPSEKEFRGVTGVCEKLKQDGFEIIYLHVDGHGLVRAGDVERAIRPDTILITLMHANNEVGTIQPIEEVAELAKARGIVFHTDAAQSAGKIPTDVRALGVNLLSIAGHKLYAPKGVGALAGLLRRGVDLVQAEVLGIDPVQRKVRTSAAEIAYDHLIVALGADLAPGAIPGLADASQTFFTFEGATRLRDTLKSFSGGRIAVVVSAMPYKCPGAPHEGAMLIADYFRRRGLSSKVGVHFPMALCIVGFCHKTRISRDMVRGNSPRA